MGNLFLWFILLGTLISCEKEESDVVYERTFVVFPQIELIGVFPPGDADIRIPGMRLFDTETNYSFTLGTAGIEGFTFEEGTSYVILVEVTELAFPPIDGRPESYRLIRIISQQ